MLKFIDEKGMEHLTQAEFSTQNGVNGERSISGTIYSGASAIHAIGRGWRLEHEDELYQITYAKPFDDGQDVIVEFDAIHVFFYDFEKSVVYGTLNGSHLFEVYLNFIFKDSGYTYKNEISVNAFEKENFGMKDRLTLFRDIINSIGAEFTVSGKIVRIVKKVGTDLSTIVKKGFNMQELTLEHDIAGFITYKKGFGAYVDDEHKEKGRLTVEYESPLAKVYGRLEGNPVVDERYKQEDSLLTRIKNEVENSYAVSVQVDMEDLVSAGYKYERPHAGDYIMAINDELSFKERIRIVSFETMYSVNGEIVDHKVTCNSLSLSSSQSKGDYNWQSKVEAGLENAINNANHALVSADGKNMVFFGEAEPTATKKGDSWYKPVGEETILYMWDGEDWVEIISTKDNKIIENKLNELSEQAEQAEKDIEESINKANQAIEQSTLSNQRADEAKRNADAAIDKANEAKQESFNSDIIARDAKEQAIKAQQLGEGNRTEITKTNEKVQLTSSKVDEHSTQIGSLKLESDKLSTTISQTQNQLDTQSKYFNLISKSDIEKAKKVDFLTDFPNGYFVEFNTQKSETYTASTNFKLASNGFTDVFFIRHKFDAPGSATHGIWSGMSRTFRSTENSMMLVFRDKAILAKFIEKEFWLKVEKGPVATPFVESLYDFTPKHEFTTFEQNAKGFQLTAQNDIDGLKSQQTQTATQVSVVVEDNKQNKQEITVLKNLLDVNIAETKDNTKNVANLRLESDRLSSSIVKVSEQSNFVNFLSAWWLDQFKKDEKFPNFLSLKFAVEKDFKYTLTSSHPRTPEGWARVYYSINDWDQPSTGTNGLNKDIPVTKTANLGYVVIYLSNQDVLDDLKSGKRFLKLEKGVKFTGYTTAPSDTTNKREFSDFVQTQEGFRQTVQNDITGIKSEQVQMANQFTSTISNLNVANQNLILDSDKAQITSMNNSVLNTKNDQAVSEWGATDAFRAWGRTVDKELFGIIWTGHTGGKLLQRNTDYTHSIWIKNNTSTPLRVGNNMGNSITVEGNTQRRVHMSVKSASDKDMGMALTFYSESTGFDFYYWHPMIAEGNVLSGYSSSSNEGVTQTQFTQTINDINMRVVEKGKVMSQINIDANRQLFDVQGNKVMITPETTYIENATIKSAMIDTINASKVTAGTFNGANMNVININVNSLVGNTTQFVRSAWNGINDSVQITGEGLIAYRNDGSVASKYLSDGIQIWSGGQWAGSLSDANGAVVLWAKRGKRLDFGYQGNISEGNLYYQALSINGNNGDIKFNALVRPSGNAYTGMHFTTVEYEGYRYPSVLSESMKSGIMLGPSALYFLHNGYVYPFSQVLN